MKQKRIVHLRVFRGRELNYDANGNVKNENHKVSLTYDTVEYSNFLKHIQKNGFCKVAVTAAYQGDEKVKHDDIAQEVKEAFEGIEIVATDPRDLKIAQLEKQMKALIESNSKTPKATKPAPKAIGETFEPPILPEGETIDKIGRKDLEELFPNIAELNPANVSEFRVHIRTTYPDKY